MVLALLCITAVSAAGDEPVSDTRETWRVGIAEFSSEGLTTENTYLRQSYPLLIHELLSRIETHTFVGEEAGAYRTVIQERERDRLIKLRDIALVGRDTDYLSGKTSSGAGGTGKSRVDELIESIVQLDELNLAGVEVRMEKPVEIVTDAGGGVLLPRVIGSPAVYAESKDLDFLVFGLIEEIESYLFVDIRIYQDAFGELPPLKTAFSREFLSSGSASVFASLTKLALGREWGDLSITAPVDSAEIYFDGEFKGIGEVTLSFVEPGEYSIVVRSSGYDEYTAAITVLPGSEVQVVAELVKAVPSMIQMTTVPPGAQLYSRSQWYGTTPAEIPGDEPHLQAFIKKEGYQDFLFPVLPEETDSITLALLPNKLDRTTVIEDERDGFYNVLAAFIISLPLPVYLFDVTNTLTQSYNAELQQPPSARNIDEAYRLLDMRQISFSAYIATVFVSVALFIDATIELIEYIDRVQLSTY